MNAAGPWADRIAVLAGVKPTGLAPRRRTVAVVPLPRELQATSVWPYVVPFPLEWHAKAEAGKLIVSAAEEDITDPHDAWADDMMLTEGLDRFMRDTTVEVQRLESSWAGLRTFAPDGLPVVGFAHEADCFFWFAGQGGFGIQTAPALAAHATSLIFSALSGRLATSREHASRVDSGSSAAAGSVAFQPITQRIVYGDRRLSSAKRMVGTSAYQTATDPAVLASSRS